MAVATALSYPDLFRENILANTRYWLEKIDKTGLSAGELGNVLRALSYALELDSAWPVASQLTLKLAPLMEQQGIWEEMHALLGLAIETSRNQGDLANEAACLVFRGNLYRLQSHLEQADQAYSEALAIYRRQGDDVGEATVLNRLAYSYRWQQRLQEAMDLCEQALAHLPEDHPERAQSIHVLALVTYDLRQWEDSLRYNQLALTHWRAEDNRHMEAKTLLNTGMVLLRLKRYEEADRHFAEAGQLFDGLNDPLHNAIALNNRGVVYMEQRIFDEALNYYNRAERIFKQYSYRRGLAWVYNNFAMVYTEQKAWPEAERAYHYSIEYCRQLKDRNNTANNLDNLALMYIAKGDLEAAHDTLQAAIAELEQDKRNPAYAYRRQIILERLDKVTRELSTRKKNEPPGAPVF